jgi:hypothetical protein
VSTPIIIVPVFSEQQQQHCLSIITILAGQIKDSYLRKRLLEAFVLLKILHKSNIQVLRLIH